MINIPHKIQFVFDRKNNVERCHFSTLTGMFDPDQMTPEVLRGNLNALELVFGDYADEQRPPFVIPEIRQLLRELRKAWPHAPFFCSLDSRFLVLEALAQVDDLIVAQADGCNVVLCSVNARQLRRYVRQAGQTIQTLGTQAGLSPAAIKARKTAFQDYLQTQCGPFQQK